MKWQLAHRPRDLAESTTVTIEAPTGWAAVEQLRAEISAVDVVLYVRASS